MTRRRRAGAEPSRSSPGDEPPEHGLQQMLARAVRMVSAVRKRQAAITRRHGVTMLQVAALHALREAGAINITELAGRLHLNQSTVSSLVARMVRDGLVVRLRDRHDRRSVKLELTEHAFEVTRIVNVSPFAFFRALLGSLNDDDRRALARVLAKLERSLDSQLASSARPRARAGGVRAVQRAASS